jgi:hypothetical protein
MEKKLSGNFTWNFKEILVTINPYGLFPDEFVFQRGGTAITFSYKCPELTKKQHFHAKKIQRSSAVNNVWQQNLLEDSD